MGRNALAPILLCLPPVRFFLLLAFLFLSGVLAAREPSIQEVQQEALRFAGYDHVDVSRWQKRARWSAALPRLQVGFSRDARRTVSLDTKDSVSVSGGNILVGPAENNFDDDVRNSTGIDVRAVWYLNELVFNRDSLDVSAEQRRWNQDRLRLLDQVNRSFFERRVSSNKDFVTAQLDALTGGWFSTELARP